MSKPPLDPPLPLGLSDEEFAAVRDYLETANMHGLTQQVERNQRLLAEIVGFLRRIDDKLAVLIERTAPKR
jgi:hypothetical protein